MKTIVLFAFLAIAVPLSLIGQNDESKTTPDPDEVFTKLIHTQTKEALNQSEYPSAINSQTTEPLNQAENTNPIKNISRFMNSPCYYELGLQLSSTSEEREKMYNECESYIEQEKLKKVGIVSAVLLVLVAVVYIVISKSKKTTVA